MLVAYREAVGTARALPLFVRVRPRFPGVLLKRSFPRLARPRGTTRLVARHVERSVQALKAEYQGRAAVSSADERDRIESELERLDAFLQSLPQTVSTAKVVRHVVLITVVLVALSAFLLPSQLRRPLRDAVDTVATGLDGVTPRNVVDSSEELWRQREAVGAVLVLAVVPVWLVSWHVLVPFRTKRVLFNLYPEPRRKLGATVLRSHRSRSTGVYVLETEVFQALSVAAPFEPPWDLIRSAMGCLALLTCLLVDAFRHIQRGTLTSSVADIYLLAVAGALVGAAFLSRDWLLRRPRQQSERRARSWMLETADMADAPGFLTLDSQALTYRVGDDRGATVVGWGELVAVEGRLLTLDVDTPDGRYTFSFARPDVAVAAKLLVARSVSAALVGLVGWAVVAQGGVTLLLAAATGVAVVALHPPTRAQAALLRREWRQVIAAYRERRRWNRAVTAWP
ncbi:MAG TPA: hypothetical protein VHF27_12475 [Acidimicrobiales bacterium]|nr:hypothetical protein [Acidimicrobiales bacterium]